jgi:Nucleotidyltransferase of unknown function (DUF6036)
MTLEQLKNLLSAAAEVTGQQAFYIIGSSAVLVALERSKERHLTWSNEVDLIGLAGDPGTADEISVAIGELSPFHETHDVYAEGCTFSTPTYAPQGWQQRAIQVPYSDIGVTAHFMELHDLALSKYGAGRDKDLSFCTALAHTGYLDRTVLAERLKMVDCDEPHRELILARTQRDFA